MIQRQTINRTNRKRLEKPRYQTIENNTEVYKEDGVKREDHKIDVQLLYSFIIGYNPPGTKYLKKETQS